MVRNYVSNKITLEHRQQQKELAEKKKAVILLRSHLSAKAKGNTYFHKVLSKHDIHVSQSKLSALLKSAVSQNKAASRRSLLQPATSLETKAILCLSEVKLFFGASWLHMKYDYSQTLTTLTPELISSKMHAERSRLISILQLPPTALSTEIEGIFTRAHCRCHDMVSPMTRDLLKALECLSSPRKIFCAVCIVVGVNDRKALDPFTELAGSIQTDNIDTNLVVSVLESIKNKGVDFGTVPVSKASQCIGGPMIHRHNGAHLEFTASHIKLIYQLCLAIDWTTCRSAHDVKQALACNVSDLQALMLLRYLGNPLFAASDLGFTDYSYVGLKPCFPGTSPISLEVLSQAYDSIITEQGLQRECMAMSRTLLPEGEKFFSCRHVEHMGCEVRKHRNLKRPAYKLTIMSLQRFQVSSSRHCYAVTSALCRKGPKGPPGRVRSRFRRWKTGVLQLQTCGAHGLRSAEA